MTSSISGCPSRAQRRSTALTSRHISLGPAAPTAPTGRRGVGCGAHPSEKSARRVDSALCARGASVGMPRSSSRDTWPSVPSRRRSVATSRRINARSRSGERLPIQDARRHRRAGRRACDAYAARESRYPLRPAAPRDQALRMADEIVEELRGNISEKVMAVKRNRVTVKGKDSSGRRICLV